MNACIDQMWPKGSPAEDLTVHLVRYPRQRVPVRGVKRREGPSNRLGGEARLHVRVGGDVVPVVEIDELVLRRVGEENKCDDRQCRDDQYFGNRQAGRRRSAFGKRAKGNHRKSLTVAHRASHIVRVQDCRLRSCPVSRYPGRGSGGSGEGDFLWHSRLGCDSGATAGGGCATSFSKSPSPQPLSRRVPGEGARASNDGRAPPASGCPSAAHG